MVTLGYHCKHSSLPIYIHTERTNADSSYTRTAHEDTEWPLKGAWTPCPRLGFVFPSPVLHSTPKDSARNDRRRLAPKELSLSLFQAYPPTPRPSATLPRETQMLASCIPKRLLPQDLGLFSLCQPVVFGGRLTSHAFSCSSRCLMELVVGCWGGLGCD